jgi:ATP-dependent Clp protease adaptor protein ClpS
MPIKTHSPVAPVVSPSMRGGTEEQHGRLFHVVLLDDDEHTYDYVIEMLQKLFILSIEAALQHAIEVDTAGKTIVITCERPQAEFAQQQIHAFGADPRMPKSKGSMSAVLVPAGTTAVR